MNNKSTRRKAIFSYDPVAEEIIYATYESLKARSNSGENLSQQDLQLLDRLNEKVKKNNSDLDSINRLLEDAYKILEDSPSWYADTKGLYELMERMVFLGIKEEGFRDFFVKLESTITEVLCLNFNNRMDIEISNEMENGTNLLNYLASCLNLIIDHVGPSIVTRTSVNTLLEASPNHGFIIFDQQMRIRFMSAVAENVLRISNIQAYGTSLSEMIDINESLLPGNRDVSSLGKTKINSTSDFLSNLRLISVDSPSTEVKEYILSFEK